MTSCTHHPFSPADSLPAAGSDAAAHLGSRATLRTYPAKSLLLARGNVADTLYYVVRGCLRLFFLHDGKELTFQFFTEGCFVASFVSFHRRLPSLFSLETIEPSDVLAIEKPDFDSLLEESPSVRKIYEEKLIDRLQAFQQQFLAHISLTPQQRYEALLHEHPELVLRVPQHYIASYLGITPVSLSRIRKRH